MIELEIGSGDKETDGQTGIGAGGIEGDAETETKEETEGKRGAKKGDGMLGWVWGDFFIFPNDVYFGDGEFFLRTDA